MGIDRTGKKAFQEMYVRQAGMVYRICFLYLKNKADTEDAVQNIFLKAWEKGKEFMDENHEKAWFITVARNYCKDELKSHWKKKRVDWEDIENQKAQEISGFEGEESPVLAGIMELEVMYRELLYLYYFEGYAIKEMADILKRKESTIQSQLASARKKLKKILQA